MQARSVSFVRAAFLALVAAAPLACGSNSTNPNCSLCSTAAIVKGTVHDSLGAAQAGAVVTVHVAAYRCSGATVGFVVSGVYPDTTDSTGKYRYSIRTPNPQFPACIEAKAVLAADTAYGADVVDSTKLLNFQNDYPAGSPLDSLTVDLVVRHH